MSTFTAEQIEKVPIINAEKRYWFIRTYSGEAFSDYYENNYVGLGVNDIPVSLIQASRIEYKAQEESIENDSFEPEFELQKLEEKSDVMENRAAFMRLVEYINLHTIYHRGAATKAAIQLTNFESNVQIGDAVVIPSKNSTEFAIGTIASEPYSVSNPGTFTFKNDPHKYPSRRRTVQWEKLIDKDSLRGDFRGISNSTRFGIANVGRYKDVIDRTIQSLYIRDNYVHFALKINQDEDINAFVLNRFLSSLTFFYQEFCRENGEEVDEELMIKIRLQSKGTLAMKALGIAGLIGIAGMMILSNNSSVKLDLKNMKIEGKSDGLLQSVSDFLDRSQERKIEWAKLQDSSNKLKAEQYSESIINENTSNKIEVNGKQ